MQKKVDYCLGVLITRVSIGVNDMVTFDIA